MAGYTIRLTPPDLRSRASEIQRNSEIVKREVEEITHLLDSLKPTFLGESAAAFFRDFTKAKGDMDNWDDIVKSFATELNEAANRLEAADRSHS